MMSVEQLQHLCLGCMTYLQHPDLPCPTCGWHNGLSNKSNQLVPGSPLGGRYLIGRVLGDGGFGITYIGWSMMQNKKVAIKEFFPDFFTDHKMTSRGKNNYSVIPFVDDEQIFEEGKNKFFEEYQTLARFDSVPNIVSVEDFFRENNTAYIVMEFLTGCTLMKHLENLGRPMTLEEILELLFPIVEALEQVHSTGLLHRDISPDNIMVTNSGAKLLDFGAARGFSIDGRKRNTINIKLGYAPKEQFFEHGNQGPWTDEYALAATIYHAITGCIPPDPTERGGNGLDTIDPPTALGAKITSTQENILLKGMALDYKDRYPTLLEFYTALAGQRTIDKIINLICDNHFVNVFLGRIKSLLK